MCSRHGTPVWSLVEVATKNHQRAKARSELRESESGREEEKAFTAGKKIIFQSLFSL